MKNRKARIRRKNSYSSTVLIILEIVVFILSLQFTMRFWSSYNAGDGILSFGIFFTRIGMAIIIADACVSFIARLGNVFNRDWENPLSIFCQQSVDGKELMRTREFEQLYASLKDVNDRLSDPDKKAMKSRRTQEYQVSELEEELAKRQQEEKLKKLEEQKEEPEGNFDDGEMKIRMNKVTVPEEEIHYMVYIKKPSGLAYSGEEILLDGIGTVRPIGEVYLEKKDGKMRFMQKVALIEN